MTDIEDEWNELVNLVERYDVDVRGDLHSSFFVVTVGDLVVVRVPTDRYKIRRTVEDGEDETWIKDNLEEAKQVVADYLESR